MLPCVCVISGDFKATLLLENPKGENMLTYERLEMEVSYYSNLHVHVPPPPVLEAGHPVSCSCVSVLCGLVRWVPSIFPCR